MSCPECGSEKRNIRNRLAGDPSDYSRHDYWCENEWHYESHLGINGAVNAIIEAWKPEFKSGGPTPSQINAAVKILKRLSGG